MGMIAQLTTACSGIGSFTATLLRFVNGTVTLLQ
jgi:hypothetical protein